MYVYRVGDVNQSVSAASQVKRLPDLEQVIFNVLEAEKSFAKCHKVERNTLSERRRA